MKRLIAIALLLSGCASFQAKMDSWHGQKADDLIFSWGPPDSVQMMSDGRKIITYRNTSMRGGNSMDCKVWFFVGADGKIIKSEGEGTLGGCNTFFSQRKAAAP